jgi:membrane protein required for colicin V production
MTLFDWGLVAVILLSVIAAAAQGFFVEMFSLAGTILGLILASWEYWRVAPYYEPYVKSGSIAGAAGFLTIFLIVVIFAGVVGKITRWAMQEVGLRWVDRLLGGAFGLVRGIVVVAAVVLAMATFAPENQMLRDSSLGRYALLAARIGSWVAPGDVRQKFKDGLVLMREKNPRNQAQEREHSPSSAPASGK